MNLKEEFSRNYIYTPRNLSEKRDKKSFSFVEYENQHNKGIKKINLHLIKIYK